MAELTIIDTVEDEVDTSGVFQISGPPLTIERRPDGVFSSRAVSQEELKEVVHWFSQPRFQVEHV